VSEEVYEAALLKELERRVEEISTYTDEAFGRIGTGEWIAFLLVAVLLPVLIVWSYA
jgi:hypothetical protein